MIMWLTVNSVESRTLHDAVAEQKCIYARKMSLFLQANELVESQPDLHTKQGRLKPRDKDWAQNFERDKGSLKAGVRAGGNGTLLLIETIPSEQY